jgi:molybdopterin/thiamine biosynthesis adenylyltransferase
MKTTITPLIIGAGGVTSYLLPILLKSFDVLGGVVFDQDVLESRNLERQLFDESYIGMNKAIALLSTLHVPTSRLMGITDYFRLGCHVPEECDIIICCADNHATRNEALKAADEYKIPAIIAGNDYFDAEAYYYHPDWRGTNRDPRRYYPDIKTDKTGSPFACQGIEAEEAAPQLAIANSSAATYVAQLLWMQIHEKRDNHPSIISGTRFSITTLSKNDYENQEQKAV